MALYSKHKIELTVATDSNSYQQKIFERNSTADEVARTDLTSSVQGTVSIVATKSKTIDLYNTDISVVRAIYIESNGAVTVSLLDSDAAANELTTLVLGGASGTGACKMFAETVGFTLAAGDTFVLTAGASAVQVTYALFGDSFTEP